MYKKTTMFVYSEELQQLVHFLFAIFAEPSEAKIAETDKKLSSKILVVRVRVRVCCCGTCKEKISGEISNKLYLNKRSCMTLHIERNTTKSKTNLYV